MELISTLTAATAAFNGVKMLVAKGSEIEHVAAKLGQWYGHIADLKEKEREIEKPPLFKRIMPGESVEAEALNLIVAKKKWEQQEKEIRELIMYAYGKDTVTEMYALRKQIRAQRERTVYAQKRRRQNLFDAIFVAVAVGVSVSIIYWTVEFIVENSR